MKIGLALPTSGRFATPEAIGQVASGAERIGLDSLWTFERLLSPTGTVDMGGRQVAMSENYNHVYSPLEVLGFVAARTSTIRLGTSIVNALLHNPAELGRSFATLDQLSGGRIVAGLGQGWMREEFEAAGVSISRRGAGFGEFVEAMRTVWGPDPVTFEGRFYRIAESRIAPKPVQAGGPPILVGAAAEASVRRAARMGLGLNPGMMGWEPMESILRTFRDTAAEADRDPDQLPVVVRVNNAPLVDGPGDRAPLTGSLDRVVQDLDRLAELGVHEVFWSMDNLDLEPAEQLEQLAEVRRAADGLPG